MNSKITTYVLAILLLGAFVFAFYQRDQAVQHEAKYEEALIDAEKSAQRIEEMRGKLEAAEKDCEIKLKQAEAALAQLQSKKK